MVSIRKSLNLLMSGLMLFCLAAQFLLTVRIVFGFDAEWEDCQRLLLFSINFLWVKSLFFRLRFPGLTLL